MFKTFAAAALLGVWFAGAAKVYIIDISIIRRNDLETMTKEEVNYVLVWLHGYFGGETTIDLAVSEENGELELTTSNTQLAE